jgi:hypothetical protein
MAIDPYTPFREFVAEMDRAVDKIHSESVALPAMKIIRGVAQGVLDRHDEAASKRAEILHDGPGLLAEDARWVKEVARQSGGTMKRRHRPNR